MKTSDAFPSKWLSAADLGGANHRVTMQRVEMEKVGDDDKPILYFNGKKKGLVLNKTNAKAIAEVYGDEMDDWASNDVILFPVMTDFQGKSVEAIRVRGPQPKDRKSAAQGIAPRAVDVDDDSIPFAPEFR